MICGFEDKSRFHCHERQSCVKVRVRVRVRVSEGSTFIQRVLTEHVFPCWKVIWDLDSVHDLEGLHRIGAILHTGAHLGVHSIRRALVGEALSSLCEVIPRDWVGHPGGSCRSGARAHVRPIEGNLLAVLSAPTEALLPNEFKGCLTESCFVKRAVGWRETVLSETEVVSRGSCN